MEITIKATPEEVKELLQTIGSSKEQIEINEQTIEKISSALGANISLATEF
ncbi:hypothetical protein [Enterococcus mundtii]|uniref:hypothetical protein n=1 Tax=Enterococcus mundtii TaxID=53346 RepID=UPI0015C317E3|nr:hypothetical protein [Enterococcus mundtii]